MERVLVVEEVITEQQRITNCLNDAGYAVTACGDAEWALAYCWQYRPNVVVVGYALGTRITESEQLVGSIKEFELDPDQPIVMLRKSDPQLLPTKASALSVQLGVAMMHFTILCAAERGPSGEKANRARCEGFLGLVCAPIVPPEDSVLVIAVVIPPRGAHSSSSSALLVW
jgi:CheY-like chemotaxis protein